MSAEVDALVLIAFAERTASSAPAGFTQACSERLSYLRDPNSNISAVRWNTLDAQRLSLEAGEAFGMLGRLVAARLIDVSLRETIDDSPAVAMIHGFVDGIAPAEPNDLVSALRLDTDAISDQLRSTGVLDFNVFNTKYVETAELEEKINVAGSIAHGRYQGSTPYYRAIEVETAPDFLASALIDLHELSSALES